MGMKYYMLTDGDSNQLADGLGEEIVQRVGQRTADSTGETVYAYSSESEDLVFTFEPSRLNDQAHTESPAAPAHARVAGLSV